ncbi:cell wall hydrolase [Mesorhizobium marinum]|uniref:cell wall hydrolase n=1 Tax=Mesorhizobium marinum TaxID=3228790 RepID=UPI003467A1FA
MHRRLVTRLVAATSRDKRSFLSPLIIGLGIWIAFPTVAAYQDMASLVSGVEGESARWNAFVEKAAAGSVHAAEMPFVDADFTTASIAGSGVSAPGIGKVSLRAKVANPIPDEDRVARASKKGRIVQIAPVAPPKTFDAGSMFKRTSLLVGPKAGEVKMAFQVPDIRGKEVEIATAFYMKDKNQRDPGVPAILASLVNNDKPDILATAYAPAKPDYYKASPFESLMKDPDDTGRFIPPVASGDHPWMREPLPAAVFSAKEQKCLATAIYFEARGESLRGQAAVAQVVLNRVRNPAYPNTVCGVVYQNEHLKNRCQFSFACDGKKDRITSPASYKIAGEVAMAVTAGKIFLPEVASSTHYYAQYVSPRWARSMEKMKKIGLHIFYRTYGGGWS